MKIKRVAFYAARSSDHTLLQWIKDTGYDINGFTVDGKTLLHCAVRAPRKEAPPHGSVIGIRTLMEVTEIIQTNLAKDITATCNIILDAGPAAEDIEAALGFVKGDPKRGGYQGPKELEEALEASRDKICGHGGSQLLGV